MSDTTSSASRRRPRRRRGPRRPVAPQPVPLPALSYPDELPIVARREEIVAAIRAHPVVVVTGATGSGKTTQLPKMCLEAGRGSRGLIACTQPRRIAATTVAARVAEELGPAGEDLVGYKIRFSDRTRPTTRIKFVTDGMLLAETQGDPQLRAYDTVIVDEAHERSLNIDFLLGILKNLLQRRRDLRVVITSATIDTEKFAAAFGGAPIIEVSGRAYPVETRYRPLDPEAEAAGDVTYVDQAVAAVVDLHRTGQREDVLVFMPTERDIAETVEALRGARLDNCSVLPLYGRLAGRDQGRVFQPQRGQKVVVATNVAETSVTVPGIRYVVDTGLARIATYNPRARTHSLPVRAISRSSADQRRGRCGRVGPGICIRLYSEEDYQKRPEFTRPEIMRANLAEVILRMLALKLGDLARFPFIDPPSARAVKDGFATLTELGAIDAQRNLTPAGRTMSRLPLDPRVSRMLLEAKKNRSLREVAIIAAALSVQDPRERPAEKRQEADAAHARFKVVGSDFLSYLKIWEAYHDSLERLKSQGKVRKFCRQHFLSFNRMREWRDVHEQITRVLREEEGFPLNREAADFAAIHKSILSGHLRNIGQKKEKNLYLGAQNKVLTVFPGSGQVNRGGPWIVAGELVETSRLFARTVASIEEEWLEELAGPLCRRSYAEPHWEKSRGQVVAAERVTLFGLAIVAGRKVNFARIDPAGARELFIRQALVEGELRGRYRFLEHNRELLGRLEDMEHRLRRRGFGWDDEALYAFYDQRLDAVCDQRTFNRLLKERGSDEFLHLREADLFDDGPEEAELEPFPSTLQLGAAQLPLSYHFEPGHEEDGVTLRVPSALASSLPVEVLEWLVPGLLAEKVTLLLKGLPKRLRRHLIPVPRSAEELLRDVGPARGSLYGRLQELLLRDYKLRVQRDDWPEASLPPHLHLRVCLVDAAGAEVRCARPAGSTALRRWLAAAAGQGGHDAGAELLAAARARWEREGVTAADLPEVPAQLELSPHGGIGYAYPALTREEDGSVALRLYPTATAAAGAGREGWLALYAAQFRSELQVLKKDLALPRAQWPLCEGLGGQAAVARDLLHFVLESVFATADGIAHAPEVFRARVAQLKGGGLFASAEELHQQVLALLTQRRQLLDVLLRQQRGANPAGKQRLRQLRQRLEQIVPPDFLRRFAADQLADAVRYLKALRVRSERAQLAPAKDEQREAQVLPQEERLSAARECSPLSAEQEQLLTEYERMIQEFHVSLFAQELGTAFPISAKRLDKKWEEIRDVVGIRPDGKRL